MKHQCEQQLEEVAQETEEISCLLSITELWIKFAYAAKRLLTVHWSFGLDKIEISVY